MRETPQREYEVTMHCQPYKMKTLSTLIFCPEIMVIS